jgi:hypothetical protein
MTNRKTAYPGRLAGRVPLILQTRDLFASNGKSSNAKEDVAVASKKLNSICPGAAS